MAVVDSYSESNQSTTQNLDTTAGDKKGIGQSFTGDGSKLTSAEFYLKKSGSPTGNATANIYAHSGTFGTSSIPTGSALAVSDVFDVSTLTTTFQLITLNFSGANQITLTNSTKYVVTFETPNAGGTAHVIAGVDNTSPTHGGNESLQAATGGAWAASSGVDVCFYVNGASTSSTNSNFFALF